MLQEAGLDPAITVREALELYGAAYPNPKPATSCSSSSGSPSAATSARRTSPAASAAGSTSRLGLVGDPELIFLDEPTTGFDPAARRQSWEMIANLRSLGKSILLTTHYMEEAQRLADRVVVLARGRVVAEGTPDELGREDARRSSASGSPRSTRTCRCPTDAIVERGTVSFRTATPTRDLAPLLGWAAHRGMELEHLTVTRPTLEDVYLDLTEEAA